MPVLNHFLRVLFQSSVLGQALTSQNYVLLVPTTDSLINGSDREVGKRYAELVEDEDFLGSHILRISTPEPGGKESNVRDNRGKAKTYTTVNNRSVIIKEGTVYTNKGFKHLTQAQLVSDALYRSPVQDAQQWLIVYISKPLVGLFEKSTPPPATIGRAVTPSEPEDSSSERPPQPTKKDIRSFNDLLNNFPMIARQMHPGLERLFNEFGKELGKPLPPPPSRTPSMVSLDGTTQTSDSASVKSNGSIRLPLNNTAYFDDEEDLMRRALETAVTAAIDLFQSVDKQQLSFLGATTDLTGPAVERLIERYVAESVHDTLLFPRLCAFHREADHDLDRRIRQMESIDVSQVGVATDNGRDAKRELLLRIEKGVTAFRKMGVAGSPQQMLDVLLETQKVVSEPPSPSELGTSTEKQATHLTINADILVSLLLLVVIRSQVRHLQTRLSYMQRFIYIDDVDSGEIGYALSTLEAVLTYLAIDSGGIRRASKQNQQLWENVKKGKLKEVRAIFDGASEPVVVDEPALPPPTRPVFSRSNTRTSMTSINEDAVSHDSGNLSHVFPFQASDSASSTGKKKKRVQMAARTLSVSSAVSMLSRTATMDSVWSAIESDVSIQSLAQTQDPSGNSIPMMAVESQQPHSLKYLLSLIEHYPLEFILNDTTSEGTTLLSAAIQLANFETIDIILKYLDERIDEHQFTLYLAKVDSRGRTAAHYIFNAPYLITKLANLLPWKKKDKIGHTPLFAVCRTYDHTEYSTMVSDALVAATNAQGDGNPLRLGYHVDLKGNTLLHIINDPTIMHRVLHQCDVDPNAMNEKKFTPLMLASKYGRTDMVRVFFGDPRIDLLLREARGLTAVELAKDDEIRNRIDDLTLFSGITSPAPDASGRITSIVRSFFVEDGSTRYIVKSGAPSSATSNMTYTITTSRRSISDFANLAKWLGLDHPASYIPSINPTNFRSPFQIHSRPSRAVLFDTQTQLDRFLRILISHPTFSMHEMLWEFFLVPDMQQEQMEMRAQMKAEFLQEQIADDYEPLTAASDLDDVDSVISHSRDVVRRVSVNNKSVIRKGYIYSHACSDMAEALSLASTAIASLVPPSTTLPKPYADAFTKMANLLHTESTSSPLISYLNALSAFQSTIGAVSATFTRPNSLVAQIKGSQKQVERNRMLLANHAIPRKGIMNIQLPGMEESRLKSMRDAEKAIADDQINVERRGKDLRYTQEVVVSELAGWTTWREEYGRQEIQRFARMMVIRERERLKGMQRVLRQLQETTSGPVSDTIV